MTDPIAEMMLLGNLTMQKIEAIQEHLKIDYGNNTIITSNYAEGVYVRECIIPAHSFIIGEIHRTEHVALMVYGHMLVWDPENGTIELEGYHKTISKPGIKRVAYTFKETLFITCHAAKSYPTDEKEIRKIYTFPNYTSFLQAQDTSLKLQKD